MKKVKKLHKWLIKFSVKNKSYYSKGLIIQDNTIVINYQDSTVINCYLS